MLGSPWRGRAVGFTALVLAVALLVTPAVGLGEDADAGPPDAATEAQKIQASAGTISEEIGEACVKALAQREGKSRADIINFITGELEMTPGAVGGKNCDLAVATASPAAMYFNALAGWFRSAGSFSQLLIAAGAVAVGAFVAWDGPVFWRSLFIGLASLAAAGVAHHEAALWDLAPNLISDMVFCFTAAVAVGLAVHVGFEGSQVLFGVLLGLVGTYGLGDWARGLETTVPGLSLMWYEFGAVVGFLLYTVWRKSVLATLAPMLGCFIATTGLVTLLTRVVHAAIGVQADGSSKVVILPGPDEAWTGASGLLLGKAGAQALAVHCAGALFATTVHGIFELRAVTIACLLLSVVTSSVSSTTGFFCRGWAGGTCPPYLQSVDAPAWPIFGSVIWAVATGLFAWRQLGLLKEWEGDNFWKQSSQYTFMPPLLPDPRGKSPSSLPEHLRPRSPDGQLRYDQQVRAPMSPVPQHELSGTFFGDVVDSLERWWEDVNRAPPPRP